MKFLSASYQLQLTQWPQNGRAILAQFDQDTIVVYQAYRPSIAEFAVKNGFFGGPDFRYGRMSWIKPNFLWMMYRSGWGTKANQECTLAIRIQRKGFDSLLRSAVHSTYQPSLFLNHEEWKQSVAESQVRVQWDPDHDPTGTPLERRAIQLGLRGDILKRFGTDWIVDIQDISSFVAHQRSAAMSGALAELQTPVENVYLVSDQSVVARLRLDHF